MAKPTSFTSETGKKARKKRTDNPGRPAALLDPELRALRGKSLVNQRLAGMPVAAVATNSGLSPRQVEREIQWMKRTGRIAGFEETVLDLVPNAVKVAGEALKEGDSKVAIKILELLLRLGDRAEARSAKAEDRTANLSDYVAKLQLTVAATRALTDAEDAVPAEEVLVHAEVVPEGGQEGLLLDGPDGDLDPHDRAPAPLDHGPGAAHDGAEQPADQ